MTVDPASRNSAWWMVTGLARWHSLGRALRTSRPADAAPSAEIHLHDFGPRRLLVDGEEEL